MRPSRTPKPSHGRFKDITGESYGLLTVLDFWCCLNKKRYIWLCSCECGNESLVNSDKLKSGHTRSCGCLHSGGRAIERHGMHDTPTYQSWEHMVDRCRKEYEVAKDYAERGIKICDRWRNSFSAFFEDMGERPEGTTLDRIDNDGNYEPGNCRWADHRQQAGNKRTNIVVTVNSKEMCLKHACEETGRNYGTAIDRVRRGWNPQRALDEPASKGSNQFGKWKIGGGRYEGEANDQSE